jgi:hypothetical protein
VQAHLVDSVVVEVTNERLVSGVAEHEGELGRAEPSIVGPQFVDDVEELFAGSVERKGVAPVAVEISCEGDVRRVSEEEADVCDPLCVRVAQIGKPVRLAIQTGVSTPSQSQSPINGASPGSRRGTE